jgi:glycosyltransferase involved in cell wall biosynthesis
MNQRPRLSIGMPVYNASRFLEQGIRSILNQTFTDFEIILSDNASTDRTSEMCQDFVAIDPRIRYYRSDTNKGGGWNHNRVLELASGEYFKWQSHDDLCAPTMLARCVDALDRNPQSPLAHGKTTVIDEGGNRLEDYSLDLRTDSPDPAIRFRDLITSYHQCYQIYGVIRRNILEHTGPMGNFVNGDGVLLANIALYGPYCKLPETLFYSRRHSAQSSQTAPARLRRRRFQLTNRVNGMPCTEWWNTSKRGSLSFPQWRQLREFILVVQRAPLTVTERLRCHAVICKWIFQDRRRYVKDLVIAADQILSNIESVFEPRGIQSDRAHS